MVERVLCTLVGEDVFGVDESCNEGFLVFRVGLRGLGLGCGRQKDTATPLAPDYEESNLIQAKPLKGR